MSYLLIIASAFFAFCLEIAVILGVLFCTVFPASRNIDWIIAIYTWQILSPSSLFYMMSVFPHPSNIFRRNSLFFLVCGMRMTQKITVSCWDTFFGWVLKSHSVPAIFDVIYPGNARYKMLRRRYYCFRLQFYIRYRMFPNISLHL